jgi:hypothetical protein
MIIIIIIIIIIIKYYLLKFFKEKYRSNRYKIYQHKSLISIDECNKLIELSRKYEFDTEPDTTDDKPEYQIDILTSKNKIDNIVLWNEIKPIYEEKIIPILNTIPFLFSINYQLDFVFLKRYKPNERTHMSLHSDDNFFTIGILLSDTSNFNGGELYIFDYKSSKKYDHIDELDTEEKDKFIKNFNNLPIINYNQGDVIVYSGNKHLHGLLPVTEGERYVLIFFFDKIKK